MSHARLSQTAKGRRPRSLAHQPISIASATKNDRRMSRAKDQHRSWGRM